MRACGDALFSSAEMNSACGTELGNSLFPKPFSEI